MTLLRISKNHCFVLTELIISIDILNYLKNDNSIKFEYILHEKNFFLKNNLSPLYIFVQENNTFCYFIVCFRWMAINPNKNVSSVN